MSKKRRMYLAEDEHIKHIRNVLEARGLTIQSALREGIADLKKISDNNKEKNLATGGGIIVDITEK